MTMVMEDGEKMGYLDKPWLKHYPRDLPSTVEVPEVTVYGLVDDSIRRNSERTAIMYYGTKISYAEIGDYIERLASALYGLGVRRNSVVAIYLPNCPQFIISYYAVQKLGAIPTAVSFLFSPREVRAVLEDCGARTLIMLGLFYDKTRPVIEELGISKIILADLLHFMPWHKRQLSILLRKTPQAKIPKEEPVYYFEELAKRERMNYPTSEVDPKEDVASIIYTSGTTGNPKGVMLTHYNIVACMQQVKMSSGETFEKSRYLLSYIPFFHMYGQNIMMTGGLSTGQTLIVVLRPEFDELLEYIHKYRVSLLFGVPGFYRILIKHMKTGNYDLSSLRVCACGSDYAPQKLKEEWKELTGVEISEGYGLTEACPATGIVVGGENKGKTGSVGYPLPGVLVAISHEERDEFVKFGEVGELIVSGPQVMKGYWNNGKRNPGAFAEIAGKRWVRTEDIGYMDKDGYAYMVERKKDVIKYKGYTMLPSEIEDVIKEYEPVREVAVVGVQANEIEFGQIVKAFIVLKDEHKGSIKRDDIIAWCKDKLAVYKVPKEIEFVDELPKNELGKIVRRKLRDKEN
jgi:long-chain acyl-CoA synthetase